MWSKFKWDMFVTSFIPLWVSIIIFDVWDIVYNAITEFPKDGKLVGRLLCFAKNNIIPFASVIIIFTVVIISIHGISRFLKERECSKQNPTGTILKVQKANKLSTEFLLAYILPLIAFDFGALKDVVLFLTYFLYLLSYVFVITIYIRIYFWNLRNIEYIYVTLNVLSSEIKKSRIMTA
jgi:hypothetical protein